MGEIEVGDVASLVDPVNVPELSEKIKEALERLAREDEAKEEVLRRKDEDKRYLALHDLRLSQVNLPNVRSSEEWGEENTETVACWPSKADRLKILAEAVVFLDSKMGETLDRVSENEEVVEALSGETFSELNHGGKVKEATELEKGFNKRVVSDDDVNRTKKKRLLSHTASDNDVEPLEDFNSVEETISDSEPVTDTVSAGVDTIEDNDDPPDETGGIRVSSPEPEPLPEPIVSKRKSEDEDKRKEKKKKSEENKSDSDTDEDKSKNKKSDKNKSDTDSDEDRNKRRDSHSKESKRDESKSNKSSEKKKKEKKKKS